MRTHEGEPGSQPTTTATTATSTPASPRPSSTKSSGERAGGDSEGEGGSLLPPTLLCSACKGPFASMEAYAAHQCRSAHKGSPAKKRRLSAATAAAEEAESFACHFCPYRSPYKGNVKRHLSLVHKIDQRDPSDA